LHKINGGIICQPGIPFGVIFKLFFAPVAAKIIFRIPVCAFVLGGIFVNYHQTDWIGCHF
jgi:hypothetical protein